MWKGVGDPRKLQEPSLRVVTSSHQRPLQDRLLQQNRAIFDEPRGLPPVRSYDHHTHLLPSSAPMVVRSYRYP